MKNIESKDIGHYTEEYLKQLAASGQLIDVRTRPEFDSGHIEGVRLHSLSEIDSFEGDLSRTYHIYCQSGKRSQQASEFLKEKGYSVVNLEGGYERFLEHKQEVVKEDRKRLNYSGMQCPGPIVHLSQEIADIELGDQVQVTVTDTGFYSDVESWAKQTGHKLIRLTNQDGVVEAVVQKEERVVQQTEHTARGTTIVLFSGELDKAIAAMIIANGARAAGREVTIFCTFWGLSALKKASLSDRKQSGLSGLFKTILPKEPTYMPLSRMNGFGLGNKFMRYVMKQKNVQTLPALIDQAIALNVKFVACTMSMDVMGITSEDLREEVHYGGVGTYIGDVEESTHNLFI